MILFALRAGAFIPVGGANSIAAAMIPAIEAAGGAVVTSAEVQQVVMKGGRAVGVRLADGREITANTVSFICQWHSPELVKPAADSRVLSLDRMVVVLCISDMCAL